MANLRPRTPRIVQLAARIEEDIRGRKLEPGDAHQNTNQIAEMLGVSTVAANRAMQLLAKRRLLSRGQGRGAVISEGIMAAQKLVLRAVHFLVHQRYLKAYPKPKEKQP